jgi:hypothetical protein
MPKAAIQLCQTSGNYKFPQIPGFSPEEPKKIKEYSSESIDRAEKATYGLNWNFLEVKETSPAEEEYLNALDIEEMFSVFVFPSQDF